MGRKLIEQWKPNLKDNNAKGNENSEGRAHEVSERNGSLLPTRLESICYTLAHNLASFCPGPKTFSEAECKNNGLICLAEEISR